MKIKTYSINGRSDWFHAHGVFAGVTYSHFASTRHAAFTEVFMRMAVKAGMRYA